MKFNMKFLSCASMIVASFPLTSLADQMTPEDLMKFTGTYELVGKCAEERTKAAKQKGIETENKIYVFPTSLLNLTVEGNGIDAYFQTDEEKYSESAIIQSGVIYGRESMKRTFSRSQMKVEEKKLSDSFIPPQKFQRHTSIQMKKDGELSLRVRVDGVSKTEESECELRRIAPYRFQDHVEHVVSKRSGDHTLRQFMVKTYIDSKDPVLRKEIADAFKTLNDKIPQFKAHGQPIVRLPTVSEDGTR
ncbi:MAG: hypothetical protein ACAH59_04610 [Pseudobdellovibrionaceae bacterium]